MRALAICLVACLLLSPITAQSDEALQFEPAVAELSGKVLVDYVMVGSEMYKGHILYLAMPMYPNGSAVKINGNPQSQASKKTARNIDKIFLEPEPSINFENLAGQVVTVEGKLFDAPSEYHHTRILMRVSSVVIHSQTDSP